ncbi:hypothetical protein [Tardiphaga sp. 862_B3_N1_1]|uniref:hypothetical protein n=1 Tax=Tardiphaga sp. 862_B3_N1_1 TaxID=3240763 RepID=UPI003F886399
MNELHEKILEILPCSMRGIEAWVGDGVPQKDVWDAVHTLRRAGIIRRYGAHGQRMFEQVGKARPGAEDEPAIELPEGSIFEDLRAPMSVPSDAEGVSPGVAAAEEKKRQRKERKRPVILFWIEGWPTQEPGRRMVWTIVWNGLPTAQREVKRLEKKFRKDSVRWEIANMSPGEVRRLKTKGFSLAEQRERERMMKETDAAPAS